MIISALFLIAFLVGIIWPWRPIYLFLLGSVFTVVFFIAIRDWSDFSLGAILHTPGSWVSWAVMLQIEFLYFAFPVGIPILIGCAIGLVTRKAIKKRPR